MPDGEDDKKQEGEGEGGENGEIKEPVELEDFQLLINQKTDESLDSTRRMLALCEASKDSAIQTLVNLDEQGEQLDQIMEGMDEINRDMIEAEEALQGMEKCCGLCVLPWNKAKNFDENNEFADAWKNKDGPVNTDGPRPVVGGQAMISGNYITKITNDAREEEMENNVAEVGNLIGNLRNMAVDMGNEIDSQNRSIDTIVMKTRSNEARINAANKRANKLL